MEAINDDGKAHAPCLQPLRASYRRCAHGTTARGTISAIAAACAVTSARSTNMAMSPSIFRRRASFSTNLRVAAASTRIVSTNASGAAALPRASRFSATICRRAAPMCARFDVRRVASRTSLPESPEQPRNSMCGMRASCELGLRRKRTVRPSRTALLRTSHPVLKRPLQASLCALIQ